MGKISISITIMAHPKRRKQAEALHVQLAQYPFKQCHITWDPQTSEWHTGERAIRAGMNAGADWHIVLQDDAVLSGNFYENVANALTNAPDRVMVSLYTGTVRPLPTRVKAAVQKAPYGSYLRGFTLFWGVAVAIPTNHIEPMLEYCAGRTELYDSRLGIFYNRNRLQVLYTHPSLVNHNDDLGSLLDHGQTKTPRVAINFINEPVTWRNVVTDI